MPPLVSGEPAEDALGDDEPLAGDGDTIDTGVLELDDEAVATPTKRRSTRSMTTTLRMTSPEPALSSALDAAREGIAGDAGKNTLTGTLDGACVVAVWVEVVAAAGRSRRHAGCRPRMRP